MTPIQHLKELKLAELRERYPHTRAFDYQANFKDTTEKSLEDCIIYFAELEKFVAKRTKVKPNRVDKRHSYIDAVGFKRTIGTVTYGKSSMQAGFSDMTLSIKGKTIFCEIKIPGDHQKKNQKTFQKEVEAGGAIYWIVTNFSDFYQKYHELQNV